MSEDFENFEALILKSLRMYHSPSGRLVFVVDPAGEGGGGIFYAGDDEFSLSARLMADITSTTYTPDGIEMAREWLKEHEPDDEEAFDDLMDLETRFNERMAKHIGEEINATEDTDNP